MSNLKPLEKIAEQDSGDLLRLHLKTREEANEEQKRENTAVGYRFSDGFLYPISGRGNCFDETYKALENLRVDISSGSYFDSKILGYEVLRKYKK